MDETLSNLESDGVWLRRAALALTSDPGLAEDAAQIAWIRAWRHRSATGGAASRGWLMQVLRNAVRGQLREGVRRSARERAVAATEGSNADDPLQRIELQRITLDAIESLDEPYRSTIVERFLEGRSIEEIARRSRTPRKTVETRSRRGIERLREALDGRRDSRGVAVLGLLKEGAMCPEPTWIASAGATLGLWAAVAAAAVLALVGAMAARGTEAASERPERVPFARIDEIRVVAGPAPSEQPAPMARTSALGQNAEAGGSTSSARTVALAEAVDLDGDPVPGVELVVVRPVVGPAFPASGVRTDPTGRVALHAPQAHAGVHLVDVAPGEPLGAVLRPRLLAGAVARVVVADELADGVRIVDVIGAPIEGARARALVDVDRLERFGTGDGVESIPRWSVTADASGDADVTGFPRHAAVEIELSAAGFVPVVLPSEQLPRVVELHRVSDTGLVGRVLDPLGVPVEGAWVGAGESLVRTGPDGRFSIERAARARELRAVAEGFQPVRRAWHVTAGGGRFVELQLERLSETLPLVVDGAPPGGLLALLEGEEIFGLASRELGASTFHARVAAEALAVGRFVERIEPAILSMDDQRATIEGLASRPYRLSLISLERAEILRTMEVVPASAELHFPGARLGATRSVVGRVVSDGGRPVDGAEVRIGPGAIEIPPQFLRRAVTDQDGAFRFEGVGGTAWTLHVSREPGGAAAATVDLDAGSTRGPLEIEIPTCRRARLQFADTALHAARLTLLDRNGDTVPIISRVGQSTVRCESLTLGDGQTGVLEFSNRAMYVLLETGTSAVRLRLPARRAESEEGVEIIRPD
ncbi:MAG: sigma-70 family RNA polymerase sigma factor [Planctomycetota bacterium]